MPKAISLTNTKTEDSLESLFSTSHPDKPCKNQNIRRKPANQNFTLYPLSKLHELSNILKEKSPDIHYISNKFDLEERCRLRYLVDQRYQLWFAFEGSPGKETPAHCQMTNGDACLAAGNIQFDKDFKKITIINHKSGDFKPPFATMKWPLAILIAQQNELQKTGINLADELTIEKLNSSSVPEKEIKAQIHDIEKLITNEMRQRVRSQPTDVVIKNLTKNSNVSYAPNKNNKNNNGTKKALLFGVGNNTTPSSTGSSSSENNNQTTVKAPDSLMDLLSMENNVPSAGSSSSVNNNSVPSQTTVKAQVSLMDLLLTANNASSAGSSSSQKTNQNKDKTQESAIKTLNFFTSNNNQNEHNKRTPEKGKLPYTLQQHKKVKNNNFPPFKFK